ncbi:MAG: hypothetical protein OEZ59_10910 [Deltaproteobacteria bacterium]|nr:hypothetical protein [Deltaproteobacteria bacterium]
MNDTTPAPRVLLGLREIRKNLPDGITLGPLEWDILKGARIHVRCATSGHWPVLCGLLTGGLEPDWGALEEPRPVKVQTDSTIWERMDAGRTINELLELEGLPESIWLQGRRRPLRIMLDWIGLEPSHMRIALGLAPAGVRERYWVARFLASEADLLLGREVFQVKCPKSRELLRLRWPDWPGAVIAACTAGSLPGAADQKVRISRQGGFSLKDTRQPALSGR